MTTSYAARSPAASPSPSPTEVGGGLSRRQSWNSSLAEAISMRDLSGAGASGSTPHIHHQPLDSDYGGGLTATPKSTISMVLPNFGNSETFTRPSLEYAATIRSEELDRLTPHAPDRGHGRSPSSRRVFDTSDGRMLPRPGTLDIITRSPTVRRVSESLRSASERVVNIMGSEKSGYEGMSPLLTRDEDSSPSPDSPISPYSSQPDDGEPPQPPPPPRPYAAPPTAALRGRTLGIFSATNPVRVLMDRVLRFPLTEPGILVLIILNVIVLTIQAAPLLTEPRQPGGFFRSWADYVLFVLYIVFTVEMFARIIVTGLIIDPDTSVTEWFRGLWRWARYRARTDEDEDDSDVIAPQVWRQRGKSFAVAQERGPKKTTLAEAPFQEAVARQHGILVEGRPYLRHSWHRIDMAAIVMFWIMFIVASVGDEITSDRHLFIFRALSVLRATRLLVITSGTATILHSLKRAGPLLLNVSVFVIFGAVLFSIIGVQSFRGSLRRQCVLYDPYNNSNPVDTGKNCGGWVHPTTAEIMPFYNQDGSLSEIKPKGYVCPINLECWTTDSNGQFNAVGFDNIFLSLVQVIVVASINTWTGTMYECMDSDFFSSALYFISCAIVLNFWLMNLIVAVVVNVFKDIRSSTKQSAFGADQSILNQPDWVANTKKPREISLLLKWYHKTEIVWVLLVVVDLIAQAFKSANSSDSQLQLLKSMEIGFAFVWDVEMIIRMAGYFPDTPPYSPDWRAFLRSGRNDFDLFLAVGCSIIQIPAVRASSVYSWLTVLQLLRWYRVILAFPRMRPLLANVFGSFAGMFNMVIFLFLMNFLSGLMAVQLLRGDMSSSEFSSELINFGQIYNSFLGMYQIFSTENWTSVLYSAMGAEWQWGQGWIVCIFLCVWFLFANFILMQMFIAVINENFEIAEEQKRKVQIEAFIRKTEPRSAHVTWMERFNPYRLIKARHKAVKVDMLPPNLILPLKQSIGADVGAPQPDNATGARAAMKRAFGMQELDHLPMRHLIDSRRSVAPTARLSTHISMHAGGGSADILEDDYDDDRGLTDLLPPITAGPTVDEHMDEIRERRNQQADFIAAHPSYDRSLWIFSQSNPIRKFCQALVPPAHGERIFGRPAHPFWSLVLKVTMFFAVVGSIVVNSYATPAYRRDFYNEHGFYRATWFDLTEMGLGCVFVFEAVVKIIADGFIFSPNAYLLSVWNVVDFVILITIIVNTATEFIVVGGLSRATRALKAFRVLRFITLFSRLRDTFHAVFFAGAMRIIDASILMILYLIPFAVWGLNIFMQRMTGCNDTTGDVTVKDQCVSEFSATPTGNIGFLAPRVWANPAFGPGNSVYSFDSFRTSMLILFEIVSLEGWINVMQTAMGIVGYNQQPGNLTQQWNSIFFVIFNLFGGVIILTVFLSIIIENFSIRSGAALLTSEQKQWIDLSKFIRQQSPSQLPRRRPRTPIRGWCYDRATQKRGYWSRFYTVLYFLHIGLLMTEDYSNNVMTEVQLDWTFLGLTVLYAIDIVARFVGLGFHSFRSNGWNLFDIVTVTGSFATTIPAIEAMRGGNQRSQGTRQVQKLFLVSICLKLVQRLDGLNQLFKTSVASLPAIGNLFLLWAVLFLFMAIVKVEIFGLTKMGNNALTRYQNYHTVGNALVMLSFMSTGENWNGYMHDFTVEFPRCTASSNYLNDDCGSVGWAYVLFSFWNILSMYIFVNMFTGVVVQSFSYVYQMPGGANLSRDQIRSFKRVWAEIDRDRTGYITRRDLVRFFSKLTGVFEVRLYPVEYSIPNMMRTCAPDDNSSPKNVVEGEYRSVDVLKLNRQTSQIDYRKVRQRRHQYVKLFYEAKISEVPGRGISFTQMLTMLAHYKLIDDEKALEVDDLLTRRAKMERVEDLVNLDRVRGLLRTIYWRRRFLAERDQRRILAQAYDANIPAIILEPITPTPEKPSSLFEGLTGPREPLNPYPSDTDFPPLTPVHSRHASAPQTPPPLRSGHHVHTLSPSLTINGDNRHAHVPSPLSSPSRPSHTSPSPAALGLGGGGPASPTFTASYRTALSVHSDADGDLSLGRRVSHASHMSHASFASHGSFDRSYSFDGDTTRDSVFEEPDADEVVQSMATSAWADMMREAVEDEDT